MKERRQEGVRTKEKGKEKGIPELIGNLAIQERVCLEALA